MNKMDNGTIAKDILADTTENAIQRLAELGKFYLPEERDDIVTEMWNIYHNEIMGVEND